MFSTFNLKPKQMELITCAFILHLSVQVAPILRSYYLSPAKRGPHPCHVDMNFQYSGQLGPGCSKSSLVSDGKSNFLQRGSGLFF